MHNYTRVIELSNELIAAVESRNGILMQQKIDALETAYRKEFGDTLSDNESVRAFMLMNLASARYFAYNNMFGLVHARYKEVADRIGGFWESEDYSDAQKEDVKNLFTELETLHKAVPERHQNLVVGRNDTRCCLCRVMPANKTGSHMVPNFLAHPTFSWDGKGKRFHEALNHDFLNAAERNCQFYGRDVPAWRFAKGEGKEEVTEADIEKNVNQLEYDNEFCARCEERFSVLESAYSQFYNRQQKKMHPRVAYLFWLSVLWRMSMGSMSIFMDMDDELHLQKLLDVNMQGNAKDMAEADTDLGDWQYAIFRAEGLRDGDKGILGYRKECSPYVVMYNDLVMVFYHGSPTDGELRIGPIEVKREMLNDWHSPEKTSAVDRRWFWNVRDWLVESSYDFYDPVREKALRIIREQERSDGKVMSDRVKEQAIKVARLSAGPQGKLLRLHKMERIYGAWLRKKDAEKKGETYNPLLDEELFLLQKDFDMYYRDLAVMSRDPENHEKVSLFPFYEEARRAIPDDREWMMDSDGGHVDPEYMNTMKSFIKTLGPKDLDHLMNGIPEPYVNSHKGIGRNDPCPCGSGKKYKKCCGKN